MNKNLLMLSGILIVAFFLRFFILSSVPPSASLDEASIGYNAYSILKTGVDEYGNKFPMLLRAYDDWRPALYVYLVIPFIKLFGLEVISVRLPSVILSVLTVIATFLLVKEIFSNLKNKTFLAFISSFLLAISPWHIYISRLGHEANAALSFGIFGTLFFLKFINDIDKKKVYIYVSSVFLVLSFYAYQSEKVFIPLMVALLAIVYRKTLLANKKSALGAFFLGLLILLPVLWQTLSPQGLARFSGTSAFQGNDPLYTQSAKDLLRHKEKQNLIGEILNNRRFVPLRIFTVNYLSHFNQAWLFGNRGNDQFKAPDFGLMYVWEFPLIVFGIFLLAKEKNWRVKTLIFGWLLISPVAASIATQAPHAMRSYNFLPIWQILSSLSLVWIFNKVINYRLKMTAVFLLATLVAGSIAVFYKQYFFVFPKEQSSSFQYTLSKAVTYVLSRENNYSKIVFSNKDNLYQSYMFFLFYSKYDPLLYQKQGGTISGGFNETHSFGKFEFRPITLNGEDKNELLIGNINELNNVPLRLVAFRNLADKEEIIVGEN